MLSQVMFGCAMIFATTVVHTGGMVVAFQALAAARRSGRQYDTTFRKAALIAGLVIIMFLAAVVEATLWALMYVHLGAMSSFEPAVYFSTVTFTTLGYGDIVLEERWRLLAAFEAANGTMMFGWTAALIVAAVQRVYFQLDSREPTTD